MTAIETIATTMANSRSRKAVVLITADVFDACKLVTLWSSSSTTVAVTVLCTIELLMADMVFVKSLTTPLLTVSGDVNTTEVAMISLGIC